MSPTAPSLRPATPGLPKPRDADERANPYDGEANLRASSYWQRQDDRLADLSREEGERRHGAAALRAAAVDGAFRGIVGSAAYPCVGAKSAVNHDAYRLGVYGPMNDVDTTAGLCRDLFRFSREFDAIDAKFATFLATFDGPLDQDELAFEDSLWSQLQALHDHDARHHAWDRRVSSDPDDGHFSFSFGGRAFFLVGLHPGASRIARRFPFPAIAFNAHEQFERLREEGQMDRMKQVIRKKDEQLQGVPNPVLRDFGDDSEARQYSGRAVEDDWSAPFKPHGETHADGDVSKCPFHRLLRLGRSFGRAKS